MLEQIMAAAIAAGVQLSKAVIADIFDLCEIMLRLARAEAMHEVAKAAGDDDADLLGGNVQEIRQIVRNWQARIEQKYPAAFVAVIKGLAAPFN